MSCDGGTLCFINELLESLSLQWHHNERDGVSNHQPHDCLLNRLFKRRSKKTSKPRVTGYCARNSPVAGEFPAQMASNAENVSIWWRHHVIVEFGILSVMMKDLWNKKYKLFRRVGHRMESDLWMLCPGCPSDVPSPLGTRQWRHVLRQGCGFLWYKSISYYHIPLWHTVE